MEKKMKICNLIAELICKTTEENPDTTAIAEILAEIDFRTMFLQDEKMSDIVEEIKYRTRRRFFIKSGEYVVAEMKAREKVEQEYKDERRSNENTANKNTQI